jgi:hypothetical protein
MSRLICGRVVDGMKVAQIGDARSAVGFWQASASCLMLARAVVTFNW